MRAAPVAPPEPRLPELRAVLPEAGLVLALRPDPACWDGRFANNAWLQECPKPLTRQVWRVSAQRGRSSTPGVYDLGVDASDEATPDGGAPGWLLLRTQD